MHIRADCDQHFSANRSRNRPLFCLLGRWFRIQTKNFRFKKIAHTCDLKFFFENVCKVKNQNLKIISNGGLLYVKWWEDSKSGRRIQIGQHLTPFLSKKTVENWQMPDLADFDSFFLPKGGWMVSDLNYEARFGILSSFYIC